MSGGKLSNLAVSIGCAIALMVAVATIYLDCYQRLSKNYRNVPTQLFTSGPVFLVAAICGLVAAIAFFGTDPDGQGYIDKLLTLSITSPYVRGFYVGTLILVLIRSKLFQFQGSDVGGEFFYNRGTQWALNSVVLRWMEWSGAYVEQIVPNSFADPNFDAAMLQFMKAIAANTTDATYRSDIESQIQQVEQAKPATAPAAADPEWLRYRRTIVRMTLQICGTWPLRNYR